jgi:TrwC relaxase
MYPLWVGVTMSLHKLTAGSGYDYLTRQVAALDATEKGHTGLASYYTQRGETPGVWIGSGFAGIDGLTAGDPVTAEQMRALFGCGLHPLAELRQQQLEGPDLTIRDFQEVTRLGAPFRVVDGDVSPVPARGRETHRGDQQRSKPAGRRAAAGPGSGPGADRGGPRVLPRRAWTGAD